MRQDQDTVAGFDQRIAHGWRVWLGRRNMRVDEETG